MKRIAPEELDADLQHILRLGRAGLAPRDIAKRLGCSYSHVYREVRAIREMTGINLCRSYGKDEPGEGTMTGRVLELTRKGRTPRQIGQALGIPPARLQGYFDTLRRRRLLPDAIGEAAQRRGVHRLELRELLLLKLSQNEALVELVLAQESTP